MDACSNSSTMYGGGEEGNWVASIWFRTRLFSVSCDDVCVCVVRLLSQRRRQKRGWAGRGDC